MPFILEKTTNRDGTVRYCQNEGCDYKMAIETNDEASGDRAEATSGVIALSNERESSIPQGIFEKPR